jgi:SAM-dependent methyltransferase
VADPVAEGYDAVYSAWRSSAAFHTIWAQHAVEGDAAAGFEHLNFAPVGELRRLVAALDLRPGARLLDVACGAGGPGLWVARETGARVVGIDLSRVGTRLAAERTAGLGVTGASFVVGSATSIPLASGCVSGAMSIDSLQYVPDKHAAFAEIARVLGPAGHFAFTAFELESSRVAELPVLGDDPVGDYRPILEACGFSLDRYEETPGWDARLTAAYGAVIDAEPQLRPEMGDAATDSLLLEMSLTLAVRPYRRRVFVAARL